MECSSSLDERASERSRTRNTHTWVTIAPGDNSSSSLANYRMKELSSDCRQSTTARTSKYIRHPIVMIVVLCIADDSLSFSFLFDDVVEFSLFFLRLLRSYKTCLRKYPHTLSKGKVPYRYWRSLPSSFWRLFLKAARLGSQNFHLEQDSGSRIRSDSASSQQTKKSS